MSQSPPKAPKSLLTISPKRRASMTSSPTDPPADMTPTRRSSLGARRHHSGDLSDVQAKIMEKARSMERTDSMDDLDPTAKRKEPEKKEKKKKSKRKEESEGDSKVDLDASSTSAMSLSSEEKKHSRKSKPDPPPTEAENGESSSHSKKSKGTESIDDEGSDKKDRKSKSDKEKDSRSAPRSTGDREKEHAARPMSRSQGEREKDADDPKKDRRRDRKKRLNPGERAQDLQSAMRAESRARGRDVSPKKKRKDKQLEEPTYKPYSNLDNSESSHHSDNSGKKKKKKEKSEKSKKRSSSKDRDPKPPESPRGETSSRRTRSGSMGYETARVPNRSRSGEKLEQAEPDPSADPDPIIGPSSMVDGKKKKKKRHSEGDGDTASAGGEDNDSKKGDNDDTAHTESETTTDSSKQVNPPPPIDDDDTPRIRNRSNHLESESTSLMNGFDDHQSPKPNQKETIGLSPRMTSPRTPKKDSVRMSPRKGGSLHGSPGAKVSPRIPRRHLPGASPRRDNTAAGEEPLKQASPRTSPRTPKGSTPQNQRRRLRKPGEAKIFDSQGREIRLPIDSEDESADESKEHKDGEDESREDEPKADESVEPSTTQQEKTPSETSGEPTDSHPPITSPGKPGSFRIKPKNPKLVHQLKETIRLVSQDQTGAVVEATLRGLAEFLARKAQEEVSGTISDFVTDVLVGDFTPKTMNENMNVNQQSAMSQGGPQTPSAPDQTDRNVVFDPYQPGANPKVPNPPRKQSPLRPRRPSPQRNSAVNSTSNEQQQDPGANNSGLAANQSVAANHVNPMQQPAAEHHADPSRPRSLSADSGPDSVSTPPVNQPSDQSHPSQAAQQASGVQNANQQQFRHPMSHQPQQPQQGWTDEQRRQYAQYVAQQQQRQQQRPIHPQQQQQQQGQYAPQHGPTQQEQYYHPQHGQSQHFYPHANHPQGIPPNQYRPQPPQVTQPRVGDPRTQQPNPQGHLQRPGHIPYPLQPAPNGYGPQHQHHPQHFPSNQQQQHHQHPQAQMYQQYQQHQQQQSQQQHPQHPQYHQPRPHVPPNPPYPQQQQPQPPQQHAQQYVPQGNVGANNAMAPLRGSILREWALIPPDMRALRPLEHLLVGLHQVFPPRFGVPAHDYFSKWTALTITDLWPNGSTLDDGALKKALRKVKAFLHTDKLPSDFQPPQKFVCELLWHVIADAETEYKKRHEELDWVN